MMFDSLPVIIVTAKTKSAAAEMIAEMIDEDATAETRPPGHASADRVWRLLNKYYTALVRVRARAEDDPPPGEPGEGGEAHVTVLAGDELEPSVCERRLPPAGAAAAVNVLVCLAAAVPDELGALCARRRLEPVALREPSRPEPGPFPEVRGVEAVRAALHAHAWPGLRRLQPDPDPGVGEGEEGEDEELQEEVFGRALAALGGAAARTARLEGDERRAAAERLVFAFAAAIGRPTADLDLDLDLERL